MNLFNVNEKKDETELHPKYLLLKNEFQLKCEKQLVERWSNGFVDKDNKFVTEFQDTFHSSFWELFLFELFSRAGAKMDQTHQVPDFVISEPTNIYVEAVVSNISQCGRKEKERTIEDQQSMIIPPYLQDDFSTFLDEAIIRNASALKTKNNKWKKEYINKSWIDSNVPYIIALQSYDQVNYGREYIYSMMALLYGLYFDTETERFQRREYVVKPTTKGKIPINIFDTEEYADVSAVIFSCTITIGKLTALSISEGNMSLNTVYNIRKDCTSNKYVLQIVDKSCPEDLADGVFIFHNPKAKNKLPDNLFKNIAATHFYYENGEINFSGNMIPLVARFNIPTIFKNMYEPDIVENLRKYNRLSREDFYEIQ